MALWWTKTSLVASGSDETRNPNPLRGLYHLTFPLWISSEGAEYAVGVVDAAGAGVGAGASTFGSSTLAVLVLALASVVGVSTFFSGSGSGAGFGFGLNQSNIPRAGNLLQVVLLVLLGVVVQVEVLLATETGWTKASVLEVTERRSAATQKSLSLLLMVEDVDVVMMEEDEGRDRTKLCSLSVL